MKNKWAVAFVVLAVIFLVVGAIFAPASYQKTKTIEKVTSERDEYHSTVQSLTAKVSEMSETLSKSRVSFKSRVPVFGPNGQTAYAETSGTSYNMNSAKETIEKSIQEASAKLAASSASTVYVVQSETKTVKRYPAAVGAGADNTGKPWIGIDGYMGPFGLSLDAGLNLRQRSTFIERGVIKGMFRF